MLSRNYATYRPGLIDYFAEEVVSSKEVTLDPLAGTAPLIPHIELSGGSAYFNDILPLHFYINRAKTFPISKVVRKDTLSNNNVLLNELKLFLKPLRNKSLQMSEKWIHDDILEVLLDAWTKTESHKKSYEIFMKAIIILCIDSLSSVSKSQSNITWNKPGGLSSDKKINQIILESMYSYLSFYDYFYADVKIVKGGKIAFLIEDASELKLSEKVNSIFTSPPYANRYDYVRMYAPELYFLSFADKKNFNDNLNDIILGTNIVKDYPYSKDDLSYIRKRSKKTFDFIMKVEEKSSESSLYYPRYFAKYYANLFKTIDHLLKLLRKNGRIYIAVQDNVHRGEMNEMDVFLIDYFKTNGMKTSTVFDKLRGHQGKRNISTKYPLVIQKHKETIIKAIK